MINLNLHQEEQGTVVRQGRFLNANKNQRRNSMYYDLILFDASGIEQSRTLARRADGRPVQTKRGAELSAVREREHLRMVPQAAGWTVKVASEQER